MRTKVAMSALPGLVQHEGLERHRRRARAPSRNRWCRPCTASPPPSLIRSIDRRHHEQRQEQRQADQHLVGRRLAGADGLAQHPSTMTMRVKAVIISSIAGSSVSAVISTSTCSVRCRSGRRRRPGPSGRAGPGRARHTAAGQASMAAGSSHDQGAHAAHLPRLRAAARLKGRCASAALGPAGARELERLGEHVAAC